MAALAPEGDQAAPRLIVDVEATHDLRLKGQEVDFAITVTNEGDALAHKVTVHQSIPGELTPTSPTGRGRVSDDGSAITWEQGALPPGRSLEVRWSAEVTATSSLSPVSDVVVTADGIEDADVVRSFLASVGGATFKGVASSDAGWIPSARTARGDNTIYFQWTEGEGMTEASSSRTIKKANFELLSSAQVIDDGDGLESKIVLRNLRDGKLRVRGQIVHRIHNAEGLYAKLRSRAIDVVLKRHGLIRIPFRHGLPTGRYEISSRFEAE